MPTLASYSPSMLSYEQYAQLVEEPTGATGGGSITEPAPGQLSGSGTTATPSEPVPSQPIAIIPPVIGSEPLADPSGLPLGDYNPYEIIKQTQGALPVAPSDPLGMGPPTLQPSVNVEPVRLEQPTVQTEPDVATAGAGTIPAWGWMLLLVAGFYFLSRR
jgi:hypothetical protein